MTRLFIFDADDTLRRCTVPGQFYPKISGEWELIPGVKERLSTIDWTTNALGIASNQGGIARGYLTEETAYQLLCDMVTAATGLFPPQVSIQLCPHPTDGGCLCRKPEPLMLKRIMTVYAMPRWRTLFVGNQESDCEAAKRAGVYFAWAHEFFGWKR